MLSVAHEIPITRSRAPNIFHCILPAGLNRQNYGQVSANFKQLLKASIPFESSWDIQTVLVGTLVASYQEVKVIRCNCITKCRENGFARGLKDLLDLHRMDMQRCSIIE